MTCAPVSKNTAFCCCRVQLTNKLFSLHTAQIISQLHRYLNTNVILVRQGDERKTKYTYEFVTEEIKLLAEHGKYTVKEMNDRDAIADYAIRKILTDGHSFGSPKK